MSELRNMSTSLDKINFIRTLQREEKLDGNLYRACINELCNSGCHEEAFNIFKSYKESILSRTPEQTSLKLLQITLKEASWMNVKTADIILLNDIYQDLFRLFDNIKELQYLVLEDMEKTKNDLDFVDSIILEHPKVAERFNISSNRAELLEQPAKIYQERFYEYVKQGDIESAIKLKEKLKDLGVTVILPQANMYNMLLKSKKDPESQLQLFDEMKKNQVTPNTETYSIMLELLLEKGEISKATRLIEEMVNSNIPPDKKLIDNIMINWRLDINSKYQLFNKIQQYWEKHLTAEHWKNTIKDCLHVGENQKAIVLMVDAMTSLKDLKRLKLQDKIWIKRMFLKNKYPNTFWTILAALIRNNINEIDQQKVLTLLNLKSVKNIAALEVYLELLNTKWNEFKDCDKLEQTVYELFKRFKSMKYFPIVPTDNITEMSTISERVWKIAQYLYTQRDNQLSKFIELSIASSSTQFLKFPQSKYIIWKENQKYDPSSKSKLSLYIEIPAPKHNYAFRHGWFDKENSFSGDSTSVMPIQSKKKKKKTKVPLTIEITKPNSKFDLGENDSPHS